MKVATMPIAQIRRDGGTQIRAALDEATVADYAAALKAGAKLPPAVVFFDGSAHWLADGFHRIEAELRNGGKRVSVDIRKGARRDAILFACGANAEHGLRRSNADKRRAVETLLADSEWGELTDRAIAKLASVSNHLVAEVRESIHDQAQQRGNSPIHTSVSHIGKDSDSGGNGTQGEPAACQSMGTSRTTAETPSEVRREPSGMADAGMASGNGDEGAGELGVPDAPAPDEPRVTLDLLGLDDIDPEWLALVSDVEAALGAFDNHLRQAQGDLAPLLGGAIDNDIQALRMEAHELAARARKSVRPAMVCPYCKDPDDAAGRRAQCNGCHNLGYLTEDQLGAVPRELTVKGEAARVIDQKAGGYVPRKAKLRIEDEAGRELVVEHEETDADGDPAW